MSRRLKQAIVNLSGLTTAEGAALTAASIRHGEDLWMIQFGDISTIMTGASKVVKRRKLSRIGSYMSRGQVINDATILPAPQAA